MDTTLKIAYLTTFTIVFSSALSKGNRPVIPPYSEKCQNNPIPSDRFLEDMENKNGIIGQCRQSDSDSTVSHTHCTTSKSDMLYSRLYEGQIRQNIKKFYPKLDKCFDYFIEYHLPWYEYFEDMNKYEMFELINEIPDLFEKLGWTIVDKVTSSDEGNTTRTYQRKVITFSIFSKVQASTSSGTTGQNPDYDKCRDDFLHLSYEHTSSTKSQNSKIFSSISLCEMKITHCDLGYHFNPSQGIECMPDKVNYHLFKKSGNSQLFSEKWNGYEAEEKCQELGMTLAKFYNDAEWDQLHRDAFSENYPSSLANIRDIHLWIGKHNVNSDDVIDDTICAYLKSPFEISKIACDSSKENFICESRNFGPTNCRPGYFFSQYENRCTEHILQYQVFARGSDVSFDDAFDRCKKRGMMLAKYFNKNEFLKIPRNILEKVRVAAKRMSLDGGQKQWYWVFPNSANTNKNVEMQYSNIVADGASNADNYSCLCLRKRLNANNGPLIERPCNCDGDTKNYALCESRRKCQIGEYYDDITYSCKIDKVQYFHYELLHGSKKKFTEAAKSCSKLGERFSLAKRLSESDWNSLKVDITDTGTSWMGGKNVETSPTGTFDWYWTIGERYTDQDFVGNIDYSLKIDIDDSNINPQKDMCIRYNGENYEWMDTKCSSEYDYICELRNPKSNEDCDKIYSDSYKSNHMEFIYDEETELCERQVTVEYKILGDTFTHHKAKEKCKDKLGENWELARIYDKFEMDLIRQLDNMPITTDTFEKNYLWVNMKAKIESNGTKKNWYWQKKNANGEYVDDNDTQMSQNDIDWEKDHDGKRGNEEMCNTIFRNDRKYADWPCNDKLPVLCEFRP